jgi:imidazoleglycerol-phosphate dehydratase
MKKKVMRKTKETAITVELDVSDTKGTNSIVTDSAFLTHMLVTFSKFSGFGLTIKATGDIEHHLVEDVAITLGKALRNSIDGLGAIKRIAHTIVPMDDALVLVSVDAVDRPYASIDLPDVMYTHFFRSLALEAKITLHIKVLDGVGMHHIIETAFKAFGIALGDALAKSDTLMSTKGKAMIKK